MNLFAEIEVVLRDALARLQAQKHLPQELDLSRVAVEPPRDAAHGDMATNAAMVLAKPAGLNPRALAELLVDSAEIAGPGFVN